MQRMDTVHDAVSAAPSRLWQRGGLTFELTKIAQTKRGEVPVLATDLRVMRGREVVFDDRVVHPNPATQVRNDDGSLKDDALLALQRTLEQIAFQYTRGFTSRRLMRISDSDQFGGDILAVRSNAGDGVVQSGSGAGSTSWASIRGGSSLSADNNDATEIINARTAGSTFIATEGFFDFDTSSIGAAGTINSYTFTLYGTGTAENNADTLTIECRVFDWGGTLTTADWVTGANWSSNTLFANLALGSWVQTNNTANNFTSQGAGASISLTGTTSLVVGLSRLSSATAPTGINDFVTYFSEQTGTTSDPLLTVDYTPGGTDLEGAASLAAAASVTAAGTRGARGAAALAGSGALAADAERGVEGVASLAGVGAVAALGRVGLSGAVSLQGVATLSAKPPAIEGAASLSGAGSMSAVALLGHGGRAALTGTGAVAASGRVGLSGAASLGGAGAIGAAGQRGTRGSASLSGVAVIVAAASIIVIFIPPPRVRPRVYIHDALTLRRLAQLVDVTSINRSYALWEHVRQAEFDIPESDEFASLTDELAANVIWIESNEYPLPWVGKIVERVFNHRDRTITVHADSYEALLAERYLPADFTSPRGAPQSMAAILSQINALNATGIGLGSAHELDAPAMALSRARGIDALEKLIEAAGAEWWLSYLYEQGEIAIRLNLASERGADFSNSVVLSQPGNFEIASSRGNARAIAYAQTVVGGDGVTGATVTRDSQFNRADGDTTQQIVEARRVFRHGHLLAGETSFAAPTQRREYLARREELVDAGLAPEVAQALMLRERAPKRPLMGRAYPDTEGEHATSWKYLEPGNVVWLDSASAFGTGYHGPVAVIAVQPVEHERFVDVVLEVA